MTSADGHAIRFKKFVPIRPPEDCWEWMGGTVEGYGRFYLNGKQRRAHRVAYALHAGRPIPDSLVVRHSCDNKGCVNPRHLLLGTVQDNVDDAVERDLHARRERNGRAVLTESQVADIRARLKGGQAQKSLAREFGVCKSTIQWIASGKLWRGVGETA